MLKKLRRQVSLLLVLSFCLLNFHAPRAQAQMVGTDAVIAGQQAQDQRTQVADFMARDDVRQIMTRYGVDPVEAENRIDSLSNQELAELASSVDQLPAGGAVGTIVGAAVLVFLVLLITDILGLTHVFPFVNHQR